VGSGSNATVLHYVRNDQKLAEGELVLIDAGCELDGYASDITRTYPVGGRFSGPARALYEVVLAPPRGVDRGCPGATLPGSAAVASALVAGCSSWGCSGDLEADRPGGVPPYYMHSTQPLARPRRHDVAPTASAASRASSRASVFTVEPGLYVAPDDEGRRAFAASACAWGRRRDPERATRT
jgi:Xaa-Pro aminopeptidase